MNTPANCVHCGGPLRASAKFCPKCGQPVEAPPETPAAPIDPGMPPAPQEEYPPMAQTVIAEPPPDEPTPYEPGPAAPPPEPTPYDPGSPVPPEEPKKPGATKKVVLGIAIAAVLVCLCCVVAAYFGARQVGDWNPFGDEVEMIESVVPIFEEIATQVPEIEELATQIPEIEELATQAPEIEQLATGLPDLESLATDLPLPEIPLPSD